MICVLIAADDSAESVEAAKVARHLFGDDARYVVVSVAETAPVFWGGYSMAHGVPYPMVIPAPGSSNGPPLMVEADATADAVLPADAAGRRASDVADEADLPTVQSIGEVGDPAHVIVRAAEDVGADCIVLGSHDRGWLSRLFHHSVTDAVTRESSVPVLIVR